MKLILVIVLINIIYVRSKAIDDSDTVIESQLLEIADGEVVPGEVVIPEDNSDKVRVARQHGYFEGMPNYLDNPAARTISAGGGIQKTLTFGLGGGIGIGGGLAGGLGLGHGAPVHVPVHAPVQAPMQVHVAPPAPVIQYQAVPYVAGYSLTPVYAQKHIPVAPAPMPVVMQCPYQQSAPISAPAAYQSGPGLYLNKHLSAGIGLGLGGRSAENPNEYIPQQVDPQNPHQYVAVADPNYIARAAKVAEQNQNLYIEPPYQPDGHLLNNYIQSQPHKRESDIIVQSVLN